MPTENKVAPFEREERYIVIKRKDLQKVPVNYRKHLVDPMLSLLNHLPRRECVVVESDWPEYQLVWAMIEHRMAGKSVPDFNLWRRANELQERLTTTDQRIDELETQLANREQSRRAWFDECQSLDRAQADAQPVALAAKS